jgi:hypothetical protein
MNEPQVKVTLRQGFAATNWVAERGDEIDVSLADARRMVARGLAGPPSRKEDREAYDKAMRMSPREEEEARRVHDEAVVGEYLRIRLGLAAPTTAQRR